VMTQIAYAIAYMPLYLVVRKWHKVIHLLFKNLNSFDMRALKCYRPEDRELVMNNIDKFLRYRCEHEDCITPHVESCLTLATCDELMERWNQLVKAWIPLLLKDKLGKVGVPYDHVLAVALITNAYAVDQIGGMFLSSGVSWWEIFVVIAANISWVISVAPNIMGIGFWIMGIKLDSEGCLSHCTVVVLCLFAQSLATLAAHIAATIQQRAKWSVSNFLVFIAYSGINGIVTLFLFDSEHAMKISSCIRQVYSRIVNRCKRQQSRVVSSHLDQ